MGSGPFLQNQGDLGQQQLGQAPMNMSGGINPNPAMGMLPASNMSLQQPNQRFLMQGGPQQQLQHGQQPGRPNMIRPGQGPQQMIPAPNAAGGPHMAGLNPQVQNVGFPTQGMSNQQMPGNHIRRVPSQSHMVPPNMNPVVSGGMGIPQGVPPPMQHQANQMRLQHQQQQQRQQMAAAAARQMGGGSQMMNPGMGGGGVGQGPVMNSLQQPGSMGPQPHPMFPNGVPNQPSQLAASPRPNSLPPNALGMGSSGPQIPVNRASMTPDNSSAMGFLAPPQHQPQPVPQPPQTAGTPASHASPLPSNPADQLAHPSRPQSRPQSQPQHHSNPQMPPQSTPSRTQTPRSAHPSLPPNAPGMPGQPPSLQQGVRIPPPPGAGPHPRQQTPVSAGGHGPQPPQGMLQPQLTGGGQQQQPQHQPQPGMVAGPPPPPPSQQQQPQPGGMVVRQPPPGNIPLPPQGIQNMPAPAPMPLQPQPPSRNQYSSVIGSGQGLIRLLQFSGILSSENKNKLQLSWWNDLVKEYFTPKAVMRFTLWKDNQKNEAKPFEINLPILPRFFLVTTQSGVKSMTLALDGARERIYAQGHAIVECVAAVWTYKYTNGYTVTLRGPLTAHVVVTATNPPNPQAPNQGSYMLKFEEFEFDALHHDKYISLDAITGSRMADPSHGRQLTNSSAEAQSEEQQRQLEEPRVLIDQASIPGEPVNAFGIPQATMRCLELAESVGSMADLITFANETKLGPLDALAKFAQRLRDNGATLLPPTMGANQVFLNPNLNNNTNNSHNQSQPQPQMITLNSSAPPSITTPQHNASQTIPPPPKATLAGSPRTMPNSPQKEHRSVPQQNQAGTSGGSDGMGSAASPAVSTADTNTPPLSHSSLKRKQTSDTSSPAMSNAEGPPAKRSARKRGRTGTTGGAG
ncbi:hypothetical protein CC1G_11385 [Coprinopsis cinerea okayama7|uniref:LIM-domain binding protein-domain-containing protein n=1 Tax=Coprinopsis cinerea (strain Okayama-7 / 130 / ATCC MYA-4618 / FGSC 9003) TaxID=240176 RepID=A8PGI0_COPC7|nr:hypothetical protein CC1G_11385 [Coprinopsis cinerea okayama7\|eukprot:XP_001841222.2 hypothetical protein CC1G_11385 [Coprinopsis cinerea okayama7\